MSISSVVNDLVTSVSVINAQKPIPPTISGYSVGGVDDTALDPAGGQTVQINGTGFLVGATITFDGSAVAVVTYVNPNQLTFTSPAKSAGTYTIYVVNSDGGTAIYIPGIIYSVLPTWTTSAGTLGSYYETTSISNTVVASGDAPITYSLFSGSLPTGSTLYANGVITGTAPVDSSSTTYSFTIEAIDAQLQGSTRSFSLTINVDAVTWVSPANNTTYTSAVDSAISNVALSATDAAGYSVSYSANSLPTGLTLTGSNIAGTPTVIADSSTLLTATAATTNRTAVRTINWSITVAGDPFFEYNTLLIPGASTTFVDDASTNNFAVTINGDTKPNSFNPYTPGYYSNYFDGSGDYLTAPNNAAFNLSSGDWTIEGWFYFNALVTGSTLFAIQPTSGSTYSVYLNGTSGQIDISLVGSSTITMAASGSIAVGSWYHIAFVKTSTSTITCYVNGVTKNNTTSYTFSNSNSSFYIGENPIYSGVMSNGYISNFRVVKGTAVYTAAFTPPTTPLTAIANTSLLTCQSNRFIDNSTNNFTITRYGDTKIQSFQPFTPNSSYSTYGSGYFDGTGDYLTVPSNSAFSLNSVDFTVEFWMYPTGGTNAWRQIVGRRSGGANCSWQITISNTNVLNFYNGTTYATGQAIVLNLWYHIAVVRSGTTMTFFVNGVSVYSNTINPTTAADGQVLGIGANASDGTEAYTGYISDLRIVKGTAVYTTTFTPPSAPLTAIANTSLLTLQNNQSVNNNIFLDNSTNNFFVTRNGNTTQGTFSPYGGNWSNYFGGQMASALSPSSTKFNLTGDFTLEAWAFPTALPGGDWGILDARVSGGSASAWLFGISGAGKTQYYDGSARVGATTLTTNSWYHLAWVRSGSVLRGYVNGVLDYYNGAYGSGAVSPGSTAPVIGTKDYGISAAWGTTGYISNLRIVIGTAVYTTSSTTVGATIFTPSTTPLTAVTNTVVLTCQSQRFVDNSLNNFTVTPSSTTISVQRFSPFNPSSLTPTSYSGYFDGSGDSLTTPTSTAFNIGAGDFTIEGWWNFSALPSGGVNCNLFGFYGGTNYNPYMYLWGDGTIVLRTAQTSGNIFVIATGFVVNTWYHLALVRSGNTYTLYKNGVSLASGTSTSVVNENKYIVFGDGGFYLNGYMSNVRVVKGVAVYTGTFTVPTTPLQATQSSGTNIAAITGTSTSLLTLQSPTFIDNSTNNFTLTVAGNTQPTIQNPFGYTSATTNGYTVSTIGGSGYFDGTGDYLTAPYTSSYNIALNTAFTFECWVYTSSTSLLVVACRNWGYGGTGPTWSFYLNSGITPSWGIAGTGQATYNMMTSSISGVLNQWNHYVWTRNSSNVCSIYVNGVSGTTRTDGQAMTSASGDVFIGVSTNLASPYATGYMSNMRFVSGTAVYTSNFVPSSAPLTAIQNTVLLTNMTSAGIYDAAMMTTMETVADAKLSTAVSKFGGSSMYFDGTGDYLLIPSTQFQNYNFGTGDFTIECWLYQTAFSLDTVITASFTSWATSVNFYFGTRAGTPNILIFRGGNTIPITLNGNTGITASTWTHVAVSRASGVTRMFVGGVVQTATHTGSVNVGAAVQSMGIGAANIGNEPITGYIDDLRITKGYARYTTTFTPPTTAFPIY